MWNTNQISINRPRSTPLNKKLKKIFYNINGRCQIPSTNKYAYYGGSGIKNRLTLVDLSELWQRDGASQMICPSIDRIDPADDYTKANCRFTEFSENRKRRRVFRSGKRCVRCDISFIGYHPNSKFCRSCGDDVRYQPIRICKVCKSEFRSNRNRYKRCAKCDSETRPCAYCSTPITRSQGRENSHARNKNWFCSKREFGLWIASRVTRNDDGRLASTNSAP